MADWAKTDPETKKAAEQKMQTEWRKWMGEHSKMITLTEAGGKTKRVTANGVSDARNDIMLYSFVEANRTRPPRRPSKITHICKFQSHLSK